MVRESDPEAAKVFSSSPHIGRRAAILAHFLVGL